MPNALRVVIPRKPQVGDFGEKMDGSRMLVVPLPIANERPPSQCVPRIEDAAEGSLGGGIKGDWEVEEPVDGWRSAV